MKKSNYFRFLFLLLIVLSVMIFAVSCGNDDIPNDTQQETDGETVSDTQTDETSNDDVTTFTEITTSADTTVISGETSVEETTKADETTEGEITTAEETTVAEVTTVAEETTLPEETTAPEEQIFLPTLFITTDDGHSVSSHDNYHACKITLGNCDEEYAFENQTAGIRVRGNSTATCEKKPYRIKFETKHVMLGLNGNHKYKSWVLMADYFDPSLMRTMTAFNLGHTVVENAAFVSDHTHVEVYINGNYQGVYLLAEQTQINKHRVDIFEKADDDTSLEVGYLLVGQGGRADEEYTVRFNCAQELTDVYGTTMNMGLPNFALASCEYTNEQMQYISDWISAVFKITYEAIYNERYYDLDNMTCKLTRKTHFEWAQTTAEKQQETIGAVMDLNSAIRMYMLDEIVKDLDSSTFNMYVDMSPEGNKKLTFGAPWDFDFALGNTKWDSLHDPLGMYACSFLVSDGVRQNAWYILLYHADWFKEYCKERWEKIYPELLEDAQEILDLAEKNKQAYDRNFEKWHIMGAITMGWHQTPDVQKFKSQMDAAVYLNNWLVTRLKWLNCQWGDGKYTVKEVEYVFNMSDDKSALFEGYGRCTGTALSNFFRLDLTDTRDPYVFFNVSKEVTLSADAYDHIDITYKIPADSSRDTYDTEIFLVSGGMGGAEGGKSVLFTATADGKEHTASLDLSQLSFWTGDIKGIRIDFFSSTENVKDKYYIKTIRFWGEEFTIE